MANKEFELEIWIWLVESKNHDVTPIRDVVKYECITKNKKVQESFDFN